MTVFCTCCLCLAFAFLPCSDAFPCQVGMDASDMPPAPAEPLAWPCLTDPVWALHEALQLRVPADVLEHPELNRSVQSFGLAATSFAQFDAWPHRSRSYWGAFRGFGRPAPALAPRSSHDLCHAFAPGPGFPPPAPAAHTSAPATQPAQSTSEPLCFLAGNVPGQVIG